MINLPYSRKKGGVNSRRQLASTLRGRTVYQPSRSRRVPRRDAIYNMVMSEVEQLQEIEQKEKEKKARDDLAAIERERKIIRQRLRRVRQNKILIRNAAQEFEEHYKVNLQDVLESGSDTNEEEMVIEARLIANEIGAIVQEEESIKEAIEIIKERNDERQSLIREIREQNRRNAEGIFSRKNKKKSRRKRKK